MELSLIELWRATGPLARGVVVLLAGMSVASGAIAADKWRRLRKAEGESEAFLSAWREATPDASGELAARFPSSPVAALVGEIYDRTRNVDDAHRAEVHDRTVRRFVLRIGSDLKRGLATIATVGSTAPFVGLFGTVIGIVNAFHEIGTSGRGGIATVSTGIAEALVTTAFGIMVAIPAVWVFNALSQRIARLLVAVEAAGEEAATDVLARRGAGGVRASEGGR
jgi:biopolymer transport protein ExbB